MAENDDFLVWVATVLYEAEVAMHNGDAAPRRAIWSRVSAMWSKSDQSASGAGGVSKMRSSRSSTERIRSSSRTRRRRERL